MYFSTYTNKVLTYILEKKIDPICNTYYIKYLKLIMTLANVQFLSFKIIWYTETKQIMSLYCKFFLFNRSTYIINCYNNFRSDCLKYIEITQPVEGICCKTNWNIFYTEQSNILGVCQAPVGNRSPRLWWVIYLGITKHSSAIHKIVN